MKQTIFEFLILFFLLMSCTNNSNPKHLDYKISLMHVNYVENKIKVKTTISNISQDTVVAFNDVDGFNSYFELITMERDTLYNGVSSSPDITHPRAYITLLPNEVYENIIEIELNFVEEVDSKNHFKIETDKFYQLVFYYSTDHPELKVPFDPNDISRVRRLVNEEYVDTTKIIRESYKSNILKF